MPDDKVTFIDPEESVHAKLDRIEKELALILKLLRRIQHPPQCPGDDY